MRAALQYLRRAKKRTRPGRLPPRGLDHVFGGDVRPTKPKGSGYHYRPGGVDFPGRRLQPGSLSRNPRTGVYTAKPEFFDAQLDPPHGRWKPKAGNQGFSTFFPDHWTPAQVDAAIAGAFRNHTLVPGSTKVWRGTYGGVKIEGYLDPATGALKHGWPLL
ncbi:EndoU domain-containing protein [Asanoa sp. WMMD1127]|uniref:EndoU domain-containing protein n=1 Tax=Asanoa sp. WMMD1127 TaxID=3016107 RepID=UPI002417C658|nr:EndoU domain-containing protein [Asanoa sp. WMMD1127]MDG4820620.1 EndoU domain-containing protein [Asanoa sp. WMMD1127]